MGCLLTQVTDDSSTMIVLIFCTPDFSTKTIKNSKSDQFGAQIVSKFLEKKSTEKILLENEQNEKQKIREKIRFY